MNISNSRALTGAKPQDFRARSFEHKELSLREVGMFDNPASTT
jgi:hypothetical protein